MHQLSKSVDCVVVTGAGQGIGAAIARGIAAESVPVLGISKSTNAVSVCREIEAEGGVATALTVDISDFESTKRVLADWVAGTTYKRLGVVLAAGLTGPSGGLSDVSLVDWLEVFKVNILGNLAVLQGLLPRMLEAGFGRIVMFGGGGAAYGYPLFGGYALSKVATVRAVENLHEELRDKGDFAVVCLAPGAIETGMLRTIRQAGGEVRTVASIEEPVNFVTQFLRADECAFSGRFVHVRDEWARWLKQDSGELPKQQWFLRRIEL